MHIACEQHTLPRGVFSLSTVFRTFRSCDFERHDTWSIGNTTLGKLTTDRRTFRLKKMLGLLARERLRGLAEDGLHP